MTEEQSSLWRQPIQRFQSNQAFFSIDRKKRASKKNHKPEVSGLSSEFSEDAWCPLEVGSNNDGGCDVETSNVVSSGLVVTAGKDGAFSAAFTDDVSGSDKEIGGHSWSLPLASSSEDWGLCRWFDSATKSQGQKVWETRGQVHARNVKSKQPKATNHLITTRTYGER